MHFANFTKKNLTPGNCFSLCLNIVLLAWNEVINLPFKIFFHKQRNIMPVHGDVPFLTWMVMLRRRGRMTARLASWRVMPGVELMTMSNSAPEMQITVRRKMMNQGPCDVRHLMTIGCKSVESHVSTLIFIGWMKFNLVTLSGGGTMALEWRAMYGAWFIAACKGNGTASEWRVMVKNLGLPAEKAGKQSVEKGQPGLSKPRNS